jgi:uncharacterized protein (TIGR03083 family)
VHDAVAHLVGTAVDVNTGNLDGVGSDPWTAAQVHARRGASLPDLVAEWADAAPQVEATLTALGGVMAAMAVADVWNHEQDIRGALGREGGHDPAAEHLSIFGYATMRSGMVAEAGVAPLRLHSGVDEWMVGDGAPGATVTAEPYELARLICVRRTADQIRSYRSDGDPEPYVAMLSAETSDPLAP